MLWLRSLLPCIVSWESDEVRDKNQKGHWELSHFQSNTDCPFRGWICIGFCLPRYRYEWLLFLLYLESKVHTVEETRAAISDPPQSPFVPRGPSLFRYSFCSLHLCSSMKKTNKGVFFFGGCPVSKKTREWKNQRACISPFVVFNLYAGKQNKAKQKHRV